jgi:hypothetical protein
VSLSSPWESPFFNDPATTEIYTPLLDHPVLGAVYLARQSENPFGSLLALYVTAYDPLSGVVVKLPGNVETDPRTGQLSTIFDQDPQQPFEDFKVDLFSGARAPLTTPPTCASFTTSSRLVPWTSPEGATVTPSDSFEITQAPGGSVCPSSAAQEPNAPVFSAGTFAPIAGSYSPFVLHLAREDGSQTFQALDVTLPEGLTGKLAGIEECPQADIEAAERRNGLGQGGVELRSPSCPAGSEVGVVHVGAGSGTPLYVTGRAYLAGPYKGAPFSIVVVAPAVGGPFDLGTVVVRSGLFIDPHTAQVTVRSDPFPTILDGIPLDIRAVTVEMTRRGFTLNPTSCEKMSVAGTVVASSSQAVLSAPFKVGGCNGLRFKPHLVASTNGKTSRSSGASLNVSVSQQAGEANIHKVELQLPPALPSRLSTLKGACTEAQFNANPAGCPVGSVIGTAIAHTPLLTVGLTGPAYIVSHGGAAFPDVEYVLQGDVVTVVHDGKTDIQKGVTYSRFETVPDAPIASFETRLPQGPHSILSAGAHNSLCGRSLSMPTTITGQNGAVLQQQTKILATGCQAARLTRAERLDRALKACRERLRGARNHSQREACERKARKRYGPRPGGRGHKQSRA